MFPVMIPNTTSATLPQKYTAVTKALAECVRIDECKDWSDKSAALASYARQAKDRDLLRMAKRIQARAMRRVGELLKEVAPGRNQHDAGACGDAPTSRSDAAHRAGLSRDQKVTALRVASVPEIEFERQIESETPPTITQLADQGCRESEDQSQVERRSPFYSHDDDTEAFITATVSKLRQKSSIEQLGILMEVARMLGVGSGFKRYVQIKSNLKGTTNEAAA